MHPLLFEIPLGSFGILEVPAFGALLAVALGVGVALTVRLAERARLAREPVLAVCLVALFAGLFGARLGFVVLHAHDIGSFAEAVTLQNGGLSGSIGLISGGVALVLAARRYRLPAPAVLDFAAPSFAAAVALVRLGCWLEGCDFGKRLSPAAPAWLARLGSFPAGSPAFVDQVVRRELSVEALRALPVHPSELYESAAAVALLAALLVARQRVLPAVAAPLATGDEPGAGVTALATMVAYFVLRVGVDVTRAPSADVWCARVLLAAVLVFTAWTLSGRARARRR